MAVAPASAAAGPAASVSAERAAQALRRLAARLVHEPTVLARSAGREGRAEEHLRALEVALGVRVAGPDEADGNLTVPAVPVAAPILPSVDTPVPVVAPSEAPVPAPILASTEAPPPATVPAETERAR
ncbi:hypothetical protein [Georgenia sp. SUBG003]|uniref:hypothetical protein n=1 Tax=Georgenia sp. SUBG003 TaxID=1497974 RepID=UPI003AB26625